MIKIRKNNDMMTTWAELKADIRAGSSPLNIGDEIDIELKTGERVALVCEQVKNGHVTFFTKELLEDTHAMDEGWITEYKKHLSTMDRYLEKLFHILPDDLQAVICDGKLRLLREREVFGGNCDGRPKDCEQLPRYRKPKNRVKCLRGVPFPYWWASPDATAAAAFCLVDSDGSYYYAASNSYGVCFGFDI